MLVAMFQSLKLRNNNATVRNPANKPAYRALVVVLCHGGTLLKRQKLMSNSKKKNKPKMVTNNDTKK